MQEIKDELNETCFLIEELQLTEEPSREQIETKAQEMGMNLQTDKQLVYLAKECLTSPLPKYWKPVMNSRRQSYYVDLVNEKAYVDHPVDMHYQRLFEKMKNVRRPKQYDTFQLEEVSQKLRKMVQKQRNKLNIKADLNVIHEDQGNQSSPSQEVQQSQEPSKTDTEIIEFIGQGDRQLRLRWKYAQIQKEQQQIIQKKLQSELNKYKQELDIILQQELKSRQSELIAAHISDKMNLEEDQKTKQQVFEREYQQRLSNHQEAIKKKIASLKQSIETTAQTKINLKIQEIKRHYRNKVAHKKLQLSLERTPTQIMQKHKQKLSQIYSKLQKFKGLKEIKEFRHIIYRQFINKLRQVRRQKSRKYSQILKEQKVLYEQKQNNKYLNNVEGMKFIIEKSQITEKYNQFLSRYFKMQENLKFQQSRTNIPTLLQQIWENITKMKKLISQNQYSQAQSQAQRLNQLQMQLEKVRNRKSIHKINDPTISSLSRWKFQTFKPDSLHFYTPRMSLKLHKKVI